MKTVKVKHFREFILSVAEKGYKIIITGEPGSGKDYVAAKAMSKGSKAWCAFDQLGKEEGDKWIVKIPESDLKNKIAFFGTCSNMNDVEKQIIDSCGGKLCYVFVRPSPDFYKLTMAAKARDLTAKGGNAKWVADFDAKSKWPLAKVRKHLLEKQRMYFDYVTKAFKAVYSEAQMDDLLLVIVENSPAPGTTVLHGWHKWDHQDVPPAVKAEGDGIFQKQKQEGEDGK